MKDKSRSIRRKLQMSNETKSWTRRGRGQVEGLEGQVKVVDKSRWWTSLVYGNSRWWAKRSRGQVKVEDKSRSRTIRGRGLDEIVDEERWWTSRIAQKSWKIWMRQVTMEDTWPGRGGGGGRDDTSLFKLHWNVVAVLFNNCNLAVFFISYCLNKASTMKL